MPKQLRMKPANLEWSETGSEWTKSTNLKNAMRDMDRSSCGVLEEAKIARRTAGVTGILLDLSGSTGCKPTGAALAVVDDDEDMRLT